MENLKEILANKLLVVSDNVSVQEKEEAMETLGISRPTLDKYLSGDIEKISKVETATELLQFLQEKVRQRIEKIRETNLV
jgi:predicted site-specific integrase-resolvase